MGRNLALGQPTSTSSVHSWGGRLWDGSFAVDGKWNTNWGHYSCMHTNADAQPWWSVDLGSSQTVAEVWLTSRGDWGGEDNLDTQSVPRCA